MRRDGFEIEIGQVSKTKGFIFFGVLVLILIINVVIIFGQNKDKSISYANIDQSISMADNLNEIKVYKQGNNILASKNTLESDMEIINTYKCESYECIVYDLNKDNNTIIIADKDIFIYDYTNISKTVLNIDYKDYSDIKYINNNLYIKYNNKYALFNINENKYITDFIYDGININKYTNIVDSVFTAYTNNSKYNQVLDVYNTNYEVIKHLNYCTGYTNIATGYCSEHLDSTKTNEEVDKILDDVLHIYPDIKLYRLYTVKTAIETLDLSLGFDSQKYINWLYYNCAGVDFFKEEVSIIGENNPNIKPLKKEELLPGDIVMNNSIVGIFLYNDKDNNPIIIYSSNNNKVVMNTIDNPNYYRLGVWR